jgi:catechol 2,3-dioxygenase-like lactoylglutathione lyase family enzyme
VDREAVTGIGGVFFTAREPDTVRAWYRDRLGVPLEAWGGWVWRWREASDPRRTGFTVWSPFPADTDYFAPSAKPFMLNLRVRDLERMLAQLRGDGCQVLDRRSDDDNGRFGYVLDPEGTLIELWEPPPEPAPAG